MKTLKLTYFGNYFLRDKEIFTTADLNRVKQVLTRGEESDSSDMFYVGTSTGCESFVSRLLSSNDEQEEKAAIRAIHMAITLRPIRKLRDLQKRKYSTPSTILGQHAFREELNTPSIFHTVLGMQEDLDTEENTVSTIEKIEKEDEFILQEGEIVVSRGTDDLKFNMLLITKSLQRNEANLRTKSCGNFLSEQDQDEEFVMFIEDKDWIGAKMSFALVLRDDADKLVIVHLDKCISPHSTVYRMNKKATKNCYLSLRDMKRT